MTDKEILDLASRCIRWASPNHALMYDDELLMFARAVIAAQLAAPASEPVAFVDSGDDGLFVEILYGDNGSPLRFGDKLYAAQQGNAHD